MSFTSSSRGERHRSLDRLVHARARTGATSLPAPGQRVHEDARGDRGCGARDRPVRGARRAAGPLDSHARAGRVRLPEGGGDACVGLATNQVGCAHLALLVTDIHARHARMVRQGVVFRIPRSRSARVRTRAATPVTSMIQTASRSSCCSRRRRGCGAWASPDPERGRTPRRKRHGPPLFFAEATADAHSSGASGTCARRLVTPPRKDTRKPSQTVPRQAGSKRAHAATRVTATSPSRRGSRSVPPPTS